MDLACLKTMFALRCGQAAEKTEKSRFKYINTNQSTSNESGFTLSEAIVALFVLSLSSLQISELTFQFLSSFKNAYIDLVETSDLLAEYRSKIYTDVTSNDELKTNQTIRLDSYDLKIAAGRSTSDEGCLFDTVGRRCR